MGWKMRRLAQYLLCALALSAPVAAAAHPHVFVETGLALVVDDKGRVTGIEVSWRYDELYSLLVLEDLALDEDYDGKLTDEELARLNGFDLNWVEGFAGDLYLLQGEETLALGPPEGRGTTFDAGQITSRHFRPVSGGAADAPWLIQAYDPTYYTAYDLSLGVTVPEGCAVTVTPADLDRAYTLVEEALYGQPADPEGNFPEVGEAFADKVELTCAAGS